MERALTLFLGNGYSCLCSAGGYDRVDYEEEKKKKQKRRKSCLSGTAGEASPCRQTSTDAPVFTDNMQSTKKTPNIYFVWISFLDYRDICFPAFGGSLFRRM